MRKSLIIIFIFYTFHSLASTFELEWQHYTSAPSLKTQVRDHVFLNWEQKTDFYKGPFYFDSHIQAKYALDRSGLVYFDIHELYFFYKYKLNQSSYFIESIELNIGRKIKHWSVGDKYWNMGLWNPINTWNPLHIVPSGITGSLLTLNSRRWSFDFFLGAIHLPSRGPQFKRKDGEAYSGSRWFVPLPDQVNVLGQTNMDVYYSTQKPFLLDTLFQQSYLLSFKTWSQIEKTYYWMRWSFADKPVNHLYFVLNTDKLLKIEKTSKPFIDQIISFLPVRQIIFSAEWGFDYDRLSTFFTLENTKMKEVSSSPQGWDFVSGREDFTYFSALIKYRFWSNNFLQMGYLRSWFQDYSLELDKLQNKKTPYILNKYKILHGISLDWQIEFMSSRGLSRVFNLSYQYSLLNEGAWLSAKALYHINPKLYFSATLDILGAKGKEKKYFLSQFRHNDYFSWRIGYAF